MSWQSNRFMIGVRDVGRALRLNAVIASMIGHEKYEASYDEQLSAKIQPGDCLWDIGANVGYYTRKFAEEVTGRGRVIAYEPSPTNFFKLQEACGGLENVTLIQCALGKKDGKVRLQQGADDLGATSRVVPEGSPGVEIEVRSGSSLVSNSKISLPQGIKIDVEGYELEVLEGLEKILREPSLRFVGIEVHFRILKERRMSHAPAQLEKLLQGASFSTSWPDSSHVLAWRAS